MQPPKGVSRRGFLTGIGAVPALITEGVKPALLSDEEKQSVLDAFTSAFEAFCEARNDAASALNKMSYTTNILEKNPWDEEQCIRNYETSIEAAKTHKQTWQQLLSKAIDIFSAEGKSSPYWEKYRLFGSCRNQDKNLDKDKLIKHLEFVDHYHDCEFSKFSQVKEQVSRILQARQNLTREICKRYDITPYQHTFKEKMAEIVQGAHAEVQGSIDISRYLQDAKNAVATVQRQLNKEKQQAKVAREEKKHAKLQRQQDICTLLGDYFGRPCTREAQTFYIELDASSQLSPQRLNDALHNVLTQRGTDQRFLSKTYYDGKTHKTVNMAYPPLEDVCVAILGTSKQIRRAPMDIPVPASAYALRLTQPMAERLAAIINGEATFREPAKFVPGVTNAEDYYRQKGTPYILAEDLGALRDLIGKSWAKRIQQEKVIEPKQFVRQ